MPFAANREKKRIFAAKSKTTMKIGIIIAMDVEYRMMHDASKPILFKYKKI